MPRIKGRRVTYTKYTDDYVDKMLIENKLNIKRIGAFDYDKNEMKFQCTIDGHIWSNEPRRIVKGQRGCAKCANHIKITNEILDERLKDRNIKRISCIGKNIKENIEFSCNDCKHVWKAAPDNIMFAESGCPKCNCNILTNENVDKRLIDNNRDVKRIGQIKRVKIRLYMGMFNL